MKPIKITMSAFGPYKDLTIIDFNEFNDGLLLITGSTGSGKTSIFDAICFALYGESSGSTRESNSLRSDYAVPDTKTFVQLEFSHNGIIYNIERTPKYIRKKTRGEGYTEEPSTSFLTGPNIEISNNNEVTKKIEEILGLDYKQFKQVSMLSQGEFSKLLLAKAEDKTAIFRKIFDTSIFNNISNKLKQLCTSKRTEYNEQLSILNNELSKLDFDTNLTNDELLDFINNKIEFNTKLLNEQITKIDKIADQKNKLSINVELQSNINKLYDDLDTNKQLLKELETNNSDIFNQKELFNFNKILYQNIKPYVEKLDDINSKLLINDKDIEKLQSKLEETNIKYKKVMNDYQEIDDLNLQLDTINNQINSYSLAINSIEQIKQYQCDLIESTSLLDKVSKKYKDIFDKYTNDELIYYHSQAGILASHLNDLEECPVCGSTNHPHKAQLISGVLSEIELKKEKETVELLLSEKNKVITKIESINSKIGVEEKNIIKIVNDFDINKIDDLNDKIKTKYKELLDSKKVLTNNIDEIISNKHNLETTLSTINGNLELLAKNTSILNIDKEKYTKKLNSNLKNSNITIDDYNNKIIDIDKYNYLDKLIVNYNEKYNTLSTKINLLSEQTSNKIKKDIDRDIILLNELKTNYQNENIIKDNILLQLNELKGSLSSLTKIYKTLSKVEKEYSIIQNLFDTSNGTLSGKQRITFENYVQSAYLNIVLHEANKRLSIMSDSRFLLRRKDSSKNLKEKLGLEFVVFDAYTGKEREVSTLSGGESFKASLSLALGLSDVIQMYTGGIKVEALFIDEGFGTLDSESIEQALNTLYLLSENNRLIGIISHVQELISRIDNKIIVTKTNTGSNIKIISN